MVRRFLVIVVINTFCVESCNVGPLCHLIFSAKYLYLLIKCLMNIEIMEHYLLIFLPFCLSVATCNCSLLLLLQSLFLNMESSIYYVILQEEKGGLQSMAHGGDSRGGSSLPLTGGGRGLCLFFRIQVGR